jgi:hypothetical protein
MAERNHDGAPRRNATEQPDNKLNRRAATTPHRLRGDEFADDFADAEGDSSAVASRRIDKQSDS